MKNDQELQADGFTESGVNRFKATIAGYEAEVHTKSVHYGEADKAPNAPREITHEHVRAAAHAVANSYGTPVRTRNSIFLQLCEYLLTAAAGVGGGNMSETWGVATFVLSVAIAVICFVTRTFTERKA